MMTLANVGHLLGFLALFVAAVLPDSLLTDSLRYFGSTSVAVFLILKARTGYLHRRPYWTATSWRRYLAACSIPIAALLLLVAMLVALEWRLPIVGAARSQTRSLWAAGSVVLLLIGAGGLAVAIGWLADGEPSRQVTWPRWFA